MIVVLVPWRPTPEREPLWNYVRGELGVLGFPIITGDSPTRLFSLAQAFNAAAEAAGNWDQAVLSEADTWVPAPQILAGLQLDGLTWCFDRQLRFTEDETAAFLAAGEMPDRELQEAVSHRGSNGVRTITRDLWERLGGYDPTFVGWGGEDWDLINRCRLLWGEPHRITGPMWELWHHREPDYYEARHANRAYLQAKVERGGL